MKRPCVLFGLIVLVFLLVFGCGKPHSVERARELVAIGDTREKAIEILSSVAWYHEPCYVGEKSSTDLFFFGSHSYGEAEIVILSSVLEGDEYKVTRISSFESYAWHTAYANCIDRDRFED